MRLALAAAALMLVLGGALGATGQTARDDPSPTANGIYVQKDVCPFEGCVYGAWHAVKPVRVYARPEASSAVIATTSPGDWVRAVTGEVHLTPLRGVINNDRAGAGLRRGDVVWRLSFLGEGEFSVWRRGEVLTIDFLDADWADKSGIPTDWWVRVELGGGRRGWVQANDGFNCTDQLGGDPAECRPPNPKSTSRGPS